MSNQNQIPTPRTDAVTNVQGSPIWVAAEFARRLERELSAEKEAHEFTATAYRLMREERDKLEALLPHFRT